MRLMRAGAKPAGGRRTQLQSDAAQFQNPRSAGGTASPRIVGGVQVRPAVAAAPRNDHLYWGARAGARSERDGTLASAFAALLYELVLHLRRDAHHAAGCADGGALRA